MNMNSELRMRRDYIRWRNCTVQIVDCETDEVLESGLIEAKYARAFCE